MTNRDSISVPYPPRSIFLQSHVETPENITAQEERLVYYLDHFSFPVSGGIFTYYVGKRYPAQGWVTMEAVTRLNLYKRTLLSWVLPFTNKSLILCLIPLICIPWKRKIGILQGVIESQNRLAEQMLQVDYYQYDKYGAPAQETEKFITAFLYALGISYDHARSFGGTLGHIIEFDSAYRYRLLDILAETSPEALENPRKEIKNLMVKFSERESRDHLIKRFTQVSKLLSVLLLVPKVKKAFQKGIESMDFKRIQMTPADMYHVLTDNGKHEHGYDWGGKSKEERLTEYESLHTATLHENEKTREVHWYPPYKIVKDLKFD